MNGPDGAADTTLDACIAGNDLDELIREVDRRTAAADWAGLVRLRDRCRAALERGFQLWPAATMAEYRLALRAPAPWASRVLVEGAGQFAIGPLPEVAASTHRWSELAPHLASGPITAVVAHECAARGEDLAGEDVPYADVFEASLTLAPWEPSWPRAEYRDDDVLASRPDLEPLEPWPAPHPTGSAGAAIDGGEVEEALRAAVLHWQEQSSGQVRAAHATTAVAAAATIAGASGLDPASLRGAHIPFSLALQLVAWAAASGGAHGRRRGGAFGRDAGWRLVDALGGPEPAMACAWFVWDGPDQLSDRGWTLRLAVDDGAGRGWAIDAHDEE